MVLPRRDAIYMVPISLQILGGNSKDPLRPQQGLALLQGRLGKWTQIEPHISLALQSSSSNPISLH